MAFTSSYLLLVKFIVGKQSIEADGQLHCLWILRVLDCALSTQSWQRQAGGRCWPWWIDVFCVSCVPVAGRSPPSPCSLLGKCWTPQCHHISSSLPFSFQKPLFRKDCYFSDDNSDACLLAHFELHRDSRIKWTHSVSFPSRLLTVWHFILRILFVAPPPHRWDFGVNTIICPPLFEQPVVSMFTPQSLWERSQGLQRWGMELVRWGHLPGSPFQ
jgi:hypothetical protein